MTYKPVGVDETSDFPPRVETRLAAKTQALVDAAIDALVAGAPGALDTLNELAAQLANDESAVAALTAAVAAKASQADLDAVTTALGTKVNSSTYTAGLAAKQDAATMDAAVADKVTNGTATKDALNTAYARGEVSVLDPAYFTGVDNTGATDSTVAINQGIANLPASVRSVVFPAGTYVAAIQVTKANLTLRGVSWASIIKTPSGATGLANDAAIRVFANGVTIENLQIDGNRSGNPAIDDVNLGRQADGVGIYADDATVRGCYLHDTIGHKVIVWNEAFTAVPAVGTGTATNTGRKNTKILGNTCKGVSASRASIDIASTQNATAGKQNQFALIADNIVEDMPIVCHSSQDVVIVGNTIRDVSKVSHCIDIHTDANRITVVGNRCGPAGGGIWVDASTGTGTLSDVMIADNTVTDTTGTGIQATGGARVTIQGNTVDTTGAGASAVALQGAAADAVVRGNTLSRPAAHGVHITGTCTKPHVIGNKIITPGQYGVNLAGSVDALVMDNDITTPQIGVASTTGTNTRVCVQGNRIDGATTTACIFLAGSAATVRDNILTNHANTIIGIRVQGQDTLVRGNVIRGGGQGIYYPAVVTGIVVVDNYLIGGSGAVISGTATNPVVKRNQGYASELYGTGTIADTTSSVTVTHGLATTPTSITVTGRTGELLWVSARTATTFTVTRSGTSGAHTFDWSASV